MSRRRAVARITALILAALTIPAGHAVPASAAEGDEKKVYALYHGFRRTREHDGDLGTWKQYDSTANSATGQTYLNFNADLIDGDGNHQMASVNGGPVVGMQSELDEDYIEYKILLAKMANIDGFLVDFGFPEYGNTVLLKAFQRQAEKLDFEIGVNWCDSWLVAQDWIKSYRSDIQTRADKIDYFKTSLQYLLDQVYANPAAALMEGHPVIFLFGGGPNAAELQEILSAGYTYPDGVQEPYWVRRAILPGTLSNGTVRWGQASTATAAWRNIGVDVHGWITPRLRSRDAAHLSFDSYASSEDVMGYLQSYAKLWERNQKVHINTAVAFPGFDNHGCAGWGSGTFSGIDRGEGALYRDQWSYYVQNRNLIDLVFIASWSDFTEGHEIEPTQKDGYTAIETTAKYAAEYKGTQPVDKSSFLRLPQRLFEARKRADRDRKAGLDLNDCNLLLDRTAAQISAGEYPAAETLLKKAESVLEAAEIQLLTETIQVSEEDGSLHISGSPSGGGWRMNQGLHLTLAPEIAQKLQSGQFDAVMKFEYYGDNSNTFTIRSACRRARPDQIGLSQGDYSIAAEIRKDPTKSWMRCGVALYQENLALDRSLGGYDFSFSGDGLVRDISMTFQRRSANPEALPYQILEAEKEEGSIRLVIQAEPDFEKEFTLLAALYDSGRCQEMKALSKPELSQRTELRFETVAGGEDVTLKLFAWDSLSGMQPLCRSREMK